MTSWLPLCEAATIPDGEVVEVETGDLALAVFNLDGTYYVTDNSCTHGPGLLSDGRVVDGIVECDFHGGRFDIRTGAVAAPPCMIPVRTYPTTVEKGKVLIELT